MILRILIFPIALLYGLIIGFRNKLFDWGVLPSKSFDHPVIGIGNLSTGGTGKTPHIEYLVKHLKPDYKAAVLSRGYKRKSKGFQIAGKNADVDQMGDEPLQIFRKYPEITVAVCGSRKKGIKKILEQDAKNKVILLDDSFQHRYVKPGLNIILSDYHKIFTRNYMLPTGNLREFRRGAKRADALIISKTPSVFSPLDRKLILKELEKYQIKNIFFSYIKYGQWVPITEEAKKRNANDFKTVFLFTGIANPTPLSEHLKRHCSDLRVFRFSDHHQFTHNEISTIVKKYNDFYSGSKAIVTTEKDSMRLTEKTLSSLLENLPVYYVPIEVDFHQQDKELFNAFIDSYMQKFYEGKQAKPGSSE